MGVGRPVVAFTHGHLSRFLTARLLGLPASVGAVVFFNDTATVGVVESRRGGLVLTGWKPHRSVTGGAPRLPPRPRPPRGALAVREAPLGADVVGDPAPSPGHRWVWCRGTRRRPGPTTDPRNLGRRLGLGDAVERRQHSPATGAHGDRHQVGHPDRRCPRERESRETEHQTGFPGTRRSSSGVGPALTSDPARLPTLIIASKPAEQVSRRRTARRASFNNDTPVVEGERAHEGERDEQRPTAAGCAARTATPRARVARRVAPVGAWWSNDTSARTIGTRIDRNDSPFTMNSQPDPSGRTNMGRQRRGRRCAKPVHDGGVSTRARWGCRPARPTRRRNPRLAGLSIAPITPRPSDMTYSTGSDSTPARSQHAQQDRLRGEEALGGDGPSCACRPGRPRHRPHTPSSSIGRNWHSSVMPTSVARPVSRYTTRFHRGRLDPRADHAETTCRRRNRRALGCRSERNICDAAIATKCAR